MDHRYSQNEFYLSQIGTYKSRTWQITIAEDLFYNNLFANTFNFPNPIRLNSLSSVNASYRTDSFISTEPYFIPTFITILKGRKITLPTKNSHLHWEYPGNHGDNKIFTCVHFTKISTDFQPSMTSITESLAISIWILRIPINGMSA